MNLRSYSIEELSPYDGAPTLHPGLSEANSQRPTKPSARCSGARITIDRAGVGIERSHDHQPRSRRKSSRESSGVRSAAAIDEIAALGPEEDRIKGAGTSWDADNDPAHYLDVGDDGTVAGVVRLDALPANMEAYTRALEAAGTDPYRVGYLPYSIADGFERVRKDFAIWRVDRYRGLRADMALRETLTLRDIGDWGHFVGDGSQPLHVTVHYNDHGAHAMFETGFVDAHITLSDVKRDMHADVPRTPARLLSQGQIASIVGGYLTRTNREVPKLYEIDRTRGFANATPEAVAFTAQQLARGATMFRDLIALAWEDSLNERVGYPEVPVRSILSGASSAVNP
jgi:hypothetical protein